MKQYLYRKLNATMPLGRIMDIPFKLHWSIFPILAAIPIISIFKKSSWQETTLLFTLLVFVLISVLLHELGHAAAAKLQGVKTHDILLSMIGGVARLERIPEEPIQEFKIAIAGPLVNLLIFFLLGSGFIIFYALGFIPSINSLDYLLNVEDFIYQNQLSYLTLFVYVLAYSNFILFLFNLLPVFPMDGGRILRAFLASRMSRRKATSIAANIGKVLSITLVIFGLIYFRPIWSIIGLFVFMMADMENRFEIQNHKFKNTFASDMLHQNFEMVSHLMPIKTLVELYFDRNVELFLVKDGQQRIKGIITKEILESAMREKAFEHNINIYISTRYAIVNKNDNLLEVQEALVKKDLPVALVMDFGELQGVIDRETFDKHRA